MKGTTLVGLDVHKRMTSVAVAEGGRGGEVRYLGEIPSSPEALRRLVDRLTKCDRRPSFCYEACGYGVYRQLSDLGQDCMIVAPSLIPSRPGEDQPARRDDAGQAASGGRAYPSLGAGQRP